MDYRRQRLLVLALGFAGAWVYPAIASVYAVLWVILPLYALTQGLTASRLQQTGWERLGTMLLSGIFTACAAIVLVGALNVLAGWNLYLPVESHLAAGAIFSAIGLLLGRLFR